MYGKLFSSTFTGSMFGAGPEVFAVWSYVVANVVDSYVELNPPLLAAVLGADAERVRAAIERLCDVDPASRNPSEEGRRLIHEGGFQYRVVSHEIYRNMRNEEDRRIYNREAQARSRARRKPVSTSNPLKNKVSTGLSAMSAHTEAEADTDTDLHTEEDLVLVAESEKILLSKVSDHQSLIGFYHDTFLEKFGVKPQIDGKKDGQLIARLLKAHGFDAVRANLAQFFVSDDPFIKSTGYTLGVFKSTFNKLTIERTNPQHGTVETSHRTRSNVAAVKSSVTRRMAPSEAFGLIEGSRDRDK